MERVLGTKDSIYWLSTRIMLAKSLLSGCTSVLNNALETLETRQYMGLSCLAMLEFHVE